MGARSSASESAQPRGRAGSHLTDLSSARAPLSPDLKLGTFGSVLLLFFSGLHRPTEVQAFLNQDTSLSSTSPASGKLERTLGMCRSPSQSPR